MTAAPLTPHTRWYVRAEAHPVRFGETRREVIVWAVYTYTKRRADRSPILTGKPTRLDSMAAAIRYARRQARVHYGRPR